MFTGVISPLKKYFKSWHDKLSRLHPKYMFRLAKLGILPKFFLDFKYYRPLYLSCVFGTANRIQWRTKREKLVSMCKGNDNKTVSAVSVDQLQSAHPGLVSQLSVKITIALIWDAKIIVNSYSDLTYVQIVRSTSQEENLKGNNYLKYGLTHLELKFIYIMHTMGILLINISYKK